MDVLREKSAALAADTWFNKAHPNSGDLRDCFSMKFMLSEALPI